MVDGLSQVVSATSSIKKNQTRFTKNIIDLMVNKEKKDAKPFKNIAIYFKIGKF